MYEENRPSFGFKNLILRLLFIFFIVFLIIWLFPTKNYVSNLIDQKLGVSSNMVLSTNIEIMKSAARSYYNGSRLPENVGDKKEMTLKEMLEKNLLVEFKDSKGNSCDTKKSYVEITKREEDYSLKVNLSCKDGESYVISYIDPLSGEVYSKKKLDEESNVSDNDTSKDVASLESNECEYVKTSNGYYTSYGSWSSWGTEVISQSNTREVETKTEKVQIGSQRVVSGTTKQTLEPTKLKTVVNGQTKYVYICPSGYDNAGSHDTLVMCYKTITSYKDEALYKNVTYYRYRNRRYVSGSSNYKWSNCNDDFLKNSGYILTGKTR